jgi:sodium transport system permease protein
MKTILQIFRKEMMDTLRDRRTLLTMVILPILLVPLLVGVMTQVITSQAMEERGKTLRVGLETSENGAALVEYLERRKDFRVYTELEPFRFKDFIKEDSLDVALVISPEFDEQLEAGVSGNLTIYYNSNQNIPSERLEEVLTAFEQEVLKTRLDTLGVARTYIEPLNLSREDVYTSRESIGKMVGGSLPYVFVLFTLLGAMYPAIDLFTGEKERGTLETILTVPASRLHILLGKMLAVVISGVLSGLLSIVGLYLAMEVNPTMPEVVSNVLSQILAPDVILLIVLMIIPLTIFFTGVLIPASIYAKSFKEAQSIIQPMLIVVILPLAVVASLPSLELTFSTALIPVVNVALASKDILAGTMDYGLLSVVFLSLIVLAGVGILLCVRWFGREGNILRVMRL